MVGPGSISLSLHGRTVLAVVLAVIVFGGAYFYYLTTLPPIPRKQRIVFALLRGSSLTFLVLLLFEPLLRLAGTDEHPPVVAVLLDDSQSMTIVDGRGDRAERIRSFLRSSPFAENGSGFLVHYFTFAGESSKPSDAPPDSLRFAGQSTDIDNVLRTVQDARQEDNIRAAVLISDGVYTAGKNPLYIAQALGIPVYTVGVGDTAVQKDVLIDRVVVNSLSYAGEKVPVDVAIRSTGYRNARVEVTIRDGSRILDRALVTLDREEFNTSVHLAVIPEDEGTKRYTVEVSHLPGELTERNNSRQVFIHVIKSRLKVVLVAAAPSPDVAELTRTLADDPHISLRQYIGKGHQEFYGGDPPQSVLDSMDCLVLAGYPTAGSGPAAFRRIADAVVRNNKPLMYCGGREVDYSLLNELASALPFGWQGPITQNELLVSPLVPEEARVHPLITLEGNGTPSAWQKLPPVFRTQSDFYLKPGATALLVPSIQGIPLPGPLIAVRSEAHHRSIAITGYGIWRWRLMAQGDAETEQLLSQFLPDAVRWLTTHDDDKRVRVAPTKELFTTAEPAQFTAQVYTEELHPADNAEVTLEILHGGDRTAVALRPVGNGRYEGSATGLPEGDYSYRAAATLGGSPAGEDHGRFAVGMTNGEFLETRMNRSLLEQMAFRTSGMYFPIDGADSLGVVLRTMKWSPREVVHESEIELWNWRYAALAVIALLAVEWYLRKRYGMM